MGEVSELAWHQQPLIRHLAWVMAIKIALLAIFWWAFFNPPESRSNQTFTSRAIVGEPARDEGGQRP